MRTQVAKIIPGLILCLSILLTGYYLNQPRAITGNPTGEIPMDLPDQLGLYKSERVLYCTNDQCGQSFAESSLQLETPHSADAPALCTGCQAPLSLISIGEVKQLPENTPILRRLYTLQGHPSIAVTLVFSGIERKSIHRPQVCLVSQGYRITNEQSIPVQINPSQSLAVRVLDVKKIFRLASGEKVSIPSIYAYWLFNPERETDSNFARLLYQAADNAFRNYRPRWGYLSISFDATSQSPEMWKNQLDSFIPLLYPWLTELRSQLNAQRHLTTTLTSSSAESNQYQGSSDQITHAITNTPPSISKP